MNDPLQLLLTGAPLKATLFPPNSRYQALDTASLIDPSGEVVVYLRRRFVPPPERFASSQEHTVMESDRYDNLAARYLDDPELWWRLCDANRAMRPEELTQDIGRRLRITLPEGIVGINV
jgi:hypothetical protein